MAGRQSQRRLREGSWLPPHTDPCRACPTACTACLASKTDLTPGLLQVRLTIMKLKAANRRAADGREAVREEAAAARGQLDATNLELQNHLYERRFYESQVQANLEYR